MTSTWLTVPTRGDHPALLKALVVDCGLPADRIVVVRTDPAAAIPDGVRVIDDYGPPNIQRWWNRGIDLAAAYHADYCVVVNDDVAVTPVTVPAMVRTLRSTGAAICWAHPENMTGWCWTLRLSSPVRPDEQFVWWWGDNDLAMQAERTAGSAFVDADVIHHHPNEATFASPQLLDLTRIDEARFRAKWGR